MSRLQGNEARGYLHGTQILRTCKSCGGPVAVLVVKGTRVDRPRSCSQCILADQQRRKREYKSARRPPRRPARTHCTNGHDLSQHQRPGRYDCVLCHRHRERGIRGGETVQYADKIAGDPCVYFCGRVSNTVEHIDPVSRGGSKTWQNIAPACLPCNMRKGAKPLLQFLCEGAGA